MSFVINTTCYTGGYRYFDRSKTVDSGFVDPSTDTPSDTLVLSLSNLVKSGYYMTNLATLNNLASLGTYTSKFSFSDSTYNSRVLIYVPENSLRIATDEMSLFQTLAATKFTQDSRFPSRALQDTYTDITGQGYILGVPNSDLEDFTFYDGLGKEISAAQGSNYFAVQSARYKGEPIHLYTNSNKYYVYIEGYGFTLSNNFNNKGVVYLGKDRGDTSQPLIYSSYHRPRASLREVASSQTDYASDFGYAFPQCTSDSGSRTYKMILNDPNSAVGTYERENYVTTELPYAPEIYNNVGENPPSILKDRISDLPNKADLNTLGKVYSASAAVLLVYPQGIYNIKTGNDYTALPYGSSSSCYYITSKSEDGKTMLQEVFTTATDRPSYARYTPDITNINVNYTNWNNMRWG